MRKDSEQYQLKKQLQNAYQETFGIVLTPNE